MSLRAHTANSATPGHQVFSRGALRRGAIPLMVLLGLLLGSCHYLSRGTPATLIRVSDSELPVFADDMAYDGLIGGIEQSLSYLERLPAGASFQFGEDRYSAAHLIKSLRHFSRIVQRKPSMTHLKEAIAADYRVYRSVGSNGRGRILYTGYYEPFLPGRLCPSEEFSVPVYALPEDLTTIDLSLFSPDLEGRKIIGRYTDRKVVPYDDNEQIAFRKTLIDRAKVLAWVRDPVDLFFLQIQGSGKLFVDGYGPMNVHYHGTNGRPYRSIGRLLIEEGEIPRSRMSMQAIRDFLHRHPEEVQRVLAHNPSYVFFKIEKEGPLGNINVPLTPGRSLALDTRIFPKAAPGFIETQMPLVDGDGVIQRWTTLRRFVLHQDTGGAIRGPGRADLFWGSGPYAAIAAGHTQHEGRLYLFVLKPEE